MTHRGRGVTLFELLIALILIVIISAVMALMIPLRTHKLSAAAQKMAADVRYAQQLAVSKQIPAGVLFDTGADVYSVFIASTNNTTVDPFTGSAFVIDYRSEPALKGIDISSTNFGSSVSFDYMGTPRDASGANLTGYAIVTLRQGAHSCEVTVAPRTGQVKVE